MNRLHAALTLEWTVEWRYRIPAVALVVTAVWTLVLLARRTLRRLNARRQSPMPVLAWCGCGAIDGEYRMDDGPVGQPLRERLHHGGRRAFDRGDAPGGGLAAHHQHSGGRMVVTASEGDRT